MPRPKKIEILKLLPFKNAAGTQSWRVTGTKPDGTRLRKNFSDHTEAKQALADLEAEIANQPVAAKFQRTRLTAEELSAAEAAIQAANGRDIAEIINHYLGLETRAKAKGADLNAALSFVEAHFRSEVQTISVFAAYEEFIASRAATTAKTREHYESSLGMLLKTDPNKALHGFTVADIEKILSRYRNVNSKRTYRRAFSTFFSWAVRHHYCLENPCARLDKLPRDMTHVAVLSLDEVKRLLVAAVQYQDGAAAASIAIALFTGLRPSELKDLKQEDVGSDKIRVTGGKLRRKLKRSVPIPPVLAAWLARHPFTGQPAGWNYKMKALKAATAAKKWVQDIIRHTSITFQTERDKNEGLTAYNNGTSKAMMDLHYRDVIDDDKTIKEFWDLRPAKLLKLKLQVKLPESKRVPWPEKAALAKLVWRKPLVHAAADIGVSDVALRKHCVKLGIDLPAQGYWLRERRDRK